MKEKQVIKGDRPFANKEIWVNKNGVDLWKVEGSAVKPISGFSRDESRAMLRMLQTKKLSEETRNFGQ